MKAKLWLVVLAVVGTTVVAAGCSRPPAPSGSADGGKSEVTADGGKSTVTADMPSKKKNENNNRSEPKSNPEASKEAQEVETDHLRLQVNKDWKVQSGLDSASFSLQDQPIGGIDGLGYAEDISSLVPNHSEITEQKELDGLVVKAAEVSTKTSGLDGSEMEELHILFFLEDNKVVYDLHFRKGAIDESSVLEVAKSAELK